MLIKLDKTSETISELGCLPSSTNHHLNITVSAMYTDVWIETGCDWVNFYLDYSVINKKTKTKTLNYRYAVNRNKSQEDRVAEIKVYTGTRNTDYSDDEYAVFTISQAAGKISTVEDSIELTNSLGSSKVVSFGKSSAGTIEISGCPEWLGIEVVESYGGDYWPGFNTNWKYYDDIKLTALENNTEVSRSAVVDFIQEGYTYSITISQVPQGFFEIYGDNSSDTLTLEGESHEFLPGIYKYPEHFFLRRHKFPKDVEFHYGFIEDDWYTLKCCGELSEIIDQFSIACTENNPSTTEQREGLVKIRAIEDDTNVVLASIEIPVVQLKFEQS